MSTPTRDRRIARVSDALQTNSKVIFGESLVLFALVWAGVAHGFGMTDTISSPELVGASMYGLVVSGEWVMHVADTMRRVLFGFVVSLVFGTALGLLMGWSKFWEHAFQDYITVGMAFPSLFAAVFAAMWFGVSDVTPIVAGAFISFPYMARNVFEGVKNVDQDLLSMSSSFDVSRARVVKRVVVQAIMPEWFAGARYAFAITWKIVTLAELVAAESGIGFMIEQEMQFLAITGVLTWTIFFTTIILIVEYGVFQQIEKRVFDWRDDVSVGWK
jgi:ABC-type nitrate/sulfonate/bicarbonate transport system permease component